MNENQLTESPNKTEPRHISFTREAFNELQNFKAEEQAEILTSLHRMLIDKYECEREELSVSLDIASKKIAIIRQIIPSEPQLKQNNSLY